MNEKFLWGKWIEDNDHEGEIWVAWIPLDNAKNISDWKKLVTYLDKVEDSEYQMMTLRATRSEVEFLCEHSGSGYMRHNNIVKSITIPSDEELEEWVNGEDDPFYKLNSNVFIS